MEFTPLVPGSSLGPFRLDMCISDVISALKDHGSLSSLPYTIEYNQSSPLADDVCIVIPSCQLTLSIDARTQRLTGITLSDPCALPVTYGGVLLAADAIRPPFNSVYEMFGPTFPGTMDSEAGLYLLKYPGIVLTFGVPEMYRHLYTSDTNELPMRLPDGTVPVLYSVLVHSPTAQPFADPYAAPPPDDAYTLSIEGTPKDCPVCRKSPHTSGCNTGISFTVKLSSSPDVMSVGFGSGVQDVLSCFGPPNTVFARPIGKLAIHEAGMTDGDVARACCTSSHSTAGSTAPPHTIEAEASGSATGYFYNYPLLGLDVLFDGSSHTVTKFILHTNFPSHVKFNEYRKCMFRVSLKAAGVAAEDHASNSAASFTCNTMWCELESLLGVGDRPMVQAGTSVDHRGYAQSTYLYAVNGMVFEVMKEGALATLTLFETP